MVSLQELNLTQKELFATLYIVWKFRYIISFSIDCFFLLKISVVNFYPITQRISIYTQPSWASAEKIPGGEGGNEKKKTEK